jgi:sRNA-binding regulator protein Hfq
MNELIKERIKESKGKVVLIFLVNNFRYEGKILNSDDKYIEILDKKGYQIILISEIKQIEVRG